MEVATDIDLLHFVAKVNGARTKTDKVMIEIQKSN
jgi:hypothetical protein